MKKWLIIAPIGAAAAAAAVLLSKKGKGGEPKQAKPAAGKKQAKPAITKPKTGVYSFASGYKDAKTVEVALTYDEEKCTFGEVSEGFLVPTDDSHAAIIYGEDFAMQAEYASYYAGDDFAAHIDELKERFSHVDPITYNGNTGVCYFNGHNYCLAFPIEGVTADYLLIMVVSMVDESDDEAAKLPTNEMVVAILNSLTVSAK